MVATSGVMAKVTNPLVEEYNLWGMLMVEHSDDRVSIPSPPFNQTYEQEIFSFSILEEHLPSIPHFGSTKNCLVYTTATLVQQALLSWIPLR